jgi:manganese transport protein
VAFALALLASGQSSTVTGTLAGQITMEGFLHLRMRPWLRRLATRLLAIVPAVVVILMAGEGGVYRLLVLSQVVLSLQLPFAVVPLVRFTSSRQKMGPFASRRPVQVLAWLAAAAIIALNGWLAYGQIAEWTTAAGPYGWLVAAAALLGAGGLAGLLAWMTLRPEKHVAPGPVVSPEEVAAAARNRARRFRRIGVALEARDTDAAILAEAVALAGVHGAELVLMHVVEGVGGQWYGPQTGDLESRGDQAYLEGLAERLRDELKGSTVPGVRAVLGYGDVPRAIVRLARTEDVDLLVVGGHGHRALGDLVHGETIQRVRHGVSIPILAVR